MTAESRTTTTVATADGRRPFTVDFHCHVLTLAVEQLVASCPQKLAEPEMMRRLQGNASAELNFKQMRDLAPRLTDLSIRFDLMDKMGVDLQIISPSPTQYYYWADVDLAKQIVSVQNERIASMCQQHPDRLSGLGNVALQHPELAVEQSRIASRSWGCVE